MSAEQTPEMGEQIAAITDRMIQLAVGLAEVRQTVETIIEAGGGRDSFEQYRNRTNLGPPPVRPSRVTRFRRWFREAVYEPGPIFTQPPGPGL